MNKNLKPIQTEMICPNCQTKFDISGIKDAIINRIYKNIKEVLKV